MAQLSLDNSSWLCNACMGTPLWKKRSGDPLWKPQAQGVSHPLRTPAQGVDSSPPTGRGFLDGFSEKTFIPEGRYPVNSIWHISDQRRGHRLQIQTSICDLHPYWE